jgi:acetyl-CoA carboxylase biotin carboxyl carrier protein
LDLKAIKQVVELMKRSELSEFELEEEGFKLRLTRKGSEAPQVIQAVAPVTAPAAQSLASAAPAAAPAATESAPAEDPNLSTITSPMVGTFYAAASPDSPSFVKVGQKTDADTVVCIIEAMKVMNEIQAELSGTIVECLVENGQAVEYGQPLFKVKKA